MKDVWCFLNHCFQFKPDESLHCHLKLRLRSTKIGRCYYSRFICHYISFSKMTPPHSSSSFNSFRDPPVLTSLSQISCSHSHPQASASRYILYLLQWWYNLGMLHQQNVREFHLESLFHSIDRAISLSFFSFNSRSPTTFWFYDWFYCLINTFVCVPILRHYEWLNHL